jgi:hypothetical protein
MECNDGLHPHPCRPAPADLRLGPPPRARRGHATPRRTSSRRPPTTNSTSSKASSATSASISVTSSMTPAITKEPSWTPRPPSSTRPRPPPSTTDSRRPPLLPRRPAPHLNRHHLQYMPQLVRWMDSPTRPAPEHSLSGLESGTVRGPRAANRDWRTAVIDGMICRWNWVRAGPVPNACGTGPPRTLVSLAGQLVCPPSRADQAPAAAGRLRSDGRVGHDLPDLLRTAARGSDLGSPPQRVLT